MKYAILGFEKGFEDLQDYNVKGTIKTIDSTNSTEQSIKVIKEFCDAGVDGLIIQPVMGYQEYIDLINSAMNRGIHVVAAISRLYENEKAAVYVSIPRL